ncbi:histidine phosphatase family protein [Pseudaestuariivita atlantica]|uniref:Phosphoglycerate mutase n=1 Tax=Pseudaestuariivita atlantica TaxID=1317121 RepID=A0A0L1JQM6_9RHOB|nr:histidine phosphatase family protein [Pseudaestuariivita atlantica]KNG94012.1 hypothetical protein ATO11_07060 [Pseudaestuariivita atlantica]
MPAPRATTLLMIRHAPVVAPDRLSGRRDVEADVSDTAQARAVAAFCGTPDLIVRSPATRCAQTSEALWPGVEAEVDARLWEQSFGEWEGDWLADMPDLGPLSLAQLAAHQPPEGESFLQVTDRIAPALRDLMARGGRIAVVSHAGVIRASLGLALVEPPAGLAFAVGNWSVTELQGLPDGPMAIARVNWSPHDAA